MKRDYLAGPGKRPDPADGLDDDIVLFLDQHLLSDAIGYGLPGVRQHDTHGSPQWLPTHLDFYRIPLR
jgi:hypothetical protein